MSAYFNEVGVYYKNICYLNKTRKRVNEQCCDIFTKNKDYESIEFSYNNEKETYKICEGMPLIATTNIKDKGIFNTMEFNLNEIKEVEGDRFFEVEDEWYSQSEFSQSFIPGFCVTVYKYQGSDIKEDYNIHDVKWMDKKHIYTAK